ncbi:hypothetical protein PITC_025070 [Penicillium italicum]|uniref:DUF676 domain-containing protein n=1 Tax=Penicillium italicum TaxID=40296 RepID=A0A0A2LDH5_PENIT|nr:hypothetical protein PITC_025070 [Penicillium italicum]
MPWPWCFPFNQGQSKIAKTSPLPLDEETGLKLLYDGLTPKFDIIAIHGLNGHRENSWTAANGVNWLQDLLPDDMPNIRVLSWGYSLTTEANSHGKISQQKLSEQLVYDLWEWRSSTNVKTQLTKPENKNSLILTEATQTVNRPIVFIAHSLGGPIVKSVSFTILRSTQKRFVIDHDQALLYADSAQETLITNLHSIRSSTIGAIFMGTPQLDSRLIGLQSYLANAKGSDQESSNIYKEANWLVTILQSYPSISQKFRTLVVHETANPLSTDKTLDQVRDFSPATHGLFAYTIFVFE